MDELPTAADEPIEPRLKVSTSARLLPVGSYLLMSLGAAIASGLLLYGHLSGSYDSLSVRAILLEMGRANVAVMLMIYGAVTFGAIGVAVTFGRLMINTETASPRPAELIKPGIAALVAPALLWFAETRLISTAVPGALEPGTDTGPIFALAYVFLGLAVVIGLGSAVYSLIIITRRRVAVPLRDFWLLAWAAIFQAVVIYAMFGFQYRTWWLYSTAY
ncbi:MAG: hypothetical protein H0V76_00970 [Blastocatellia bacterium]|nr:hypothetical protein [Blastocatellia bacterium]